MFGIRKELDNLGEESYNQYRALKEQQAFLTTSLIKAHHKIDDLTALVKLQGQTISHMFELVEDLKKYTLVKVED